MRSGTIKTLSVVFAVIFLICNLTACNGSNRVPTELSLEVGNSAKLKPSYIINSLGDDAQIVWRSENEEIAAVSENGVVSYVSAGTARIFADGTSADGKKKATEEFIITCEIDVGSEGLLLDQFYVNLSKSGETYQLMASLVHEGDSIVKWESSDDTVAAVDGGKVTYMSPGRAVITATTQLGFTASCNVMCDTVVMTVGDISITDSMYGYWFSSYKTQVVEYNIGYDAAEVWETELTDGSTFGDLFDANVYSSVVQMLAANQAYIDEYGSIPDDLASTAKSQVALAQNENGGAEALESILSNFYVNSEILCKIFEIEELTNRYYSGVFKEGSPDEITEDQIIQRFLNSYVQADHVLIDLYYDYDEELDDYVETDEARQSEKRNEAQEIYDKIVSGELDFDDAMYEYSDDFSDNENGYIFTDDGSFDEIFTTNAFEMNVGEYRMFESDYGVHIMKKFELTEDDLSDELYAEVLSTVQTERFTARLEKYNERVEADKDAIIANYDVIDALLFTSFSK